MIPDVMGIQEVADALGVSRQRAAILSKAPGFPRGLDLSRGTVWDGPSIRAHAKDRIDPRYARGTSTRNQRCLHAYRSTGSVNAAAKAAGMGWDTAADRLRHYGVLQDEDVAV